MPLALLATFLTLGGVGLYLAMPGGRPRAGRAALILLLGAAAALVGLFLQVLVGQDARGWFIALALIGLFGAVRVITHRRPVYSALYFMLVIISVTGMLVLMQAEFLAAALLIIYAGAIVVTYVFVIMLAQQEGLTAYDRQAREPLIGCAAGFVLLSVLAGRFFSLDAPSAVPAAESAVGSVENVGTHLLTQYVVGLELAGVLLLAAMVGAIAIARRKAAEDADEGAI